MTTKDDEDKLLRSVALQTANSILIARQRAEQRSEFYLAEAQRLAHMGSWAFNPSGFFDYWSPELFQICGIDPAKGAPTLDEYLAGVHPHDRELMIAALEKMLLEGSGCDVKQRILRPDGELRYIRWVGVPALDEGAFRGFVGTALDVTEQEHLTQELRRRETYLAEAQRLSHTGSFGWRISTGEILWSEETFRIFQYDRSTKPTMELALQRVHPEDAALVKQTIERASQDGKDLDFEHRLLMPDGCVTYVHVVAHALSDESGSIEFVGTVMDVTAAKEAEDRIRLIIDTVPALIWAARPDGTLDFVSQRWLDYAGLTSEQVLGWEAPYHPDDIEQLLSKWRAAVAQGKPYENEVRLRSLDGEYRWFLSRAFPLCDRSGHILGWYGNDTDIEDRKRAEMLLAGEKRLLEMIARGDSRAIILDALCRLFEELASGSLSSILLLDPSANRLRHGAAPNLPMDYIEAIDGIVIGPSVGSCGTAAYRAEPVIVSDIATDPLWVDYRDLAFAHGLRACWSSPILSSEGRVLGTFATYYREPRSPTPQEHNVIEQITHLASIAVERAQAEEALRQAQAELAHVTRLTTLGELAASIAHEVNQPIAGVVANADAALRWLAAQPPDLEETRQALVDIANDGQRAGEILSRIRALVKKAPPQKEWLDINQTIREVIALTRGEVQRNGVSLQTQFSSSLPLIPGDRIQLQQVVLNLILNAIEAMSGVGQAQRQLLVSTGKADSNGVLVAVRDSGTGLDSESFAQLFQPFFTTKSSGMGMGLSICRGIIEAHGGRVWARPNVPKGATFQFTLPAHQESPS